MRPICSSLATEKNNDDNNNTNNSYSFGSTAQVPVITLNPSHVLFLVLINDKVRLGLALPLDKSELKRE